MARHEEAHIEQLQLTGQALSGAAGNKRYGLGAGITCQLQADQALVAPGSVGLPISNLLVPTNMTPAGAIDLSAGVFTMKFNGQRYVRFRGCMLLDPASGAKSLGISWVIQRRFSGQTTFPDIGPVNLTVTAATPQLFPFEITKLLEGPSPLWDGDTVTPVVVNVTDSTNVTVISPAGTGPAIGGPTATNVPPYAFIDAYIVS